MTEGVRLAERPARYESGAGRHYGVDAVKLAALNECGDHRPVVATFVGAGERSILPVQSTGSDAPLRHVGVEVDAAIVEEAREPVPAVKRVAHPFGELALGADVAVAGFEIEPQVVDDEAAALGACGRRPLRREPCT